MCEVWGSGQWLMGPTRLSLSESRVLGFSEVEKMETNDKPSDQMAALKAKLDQDLQRRISRALRQCTETPLDRWLRQRR